MKRLDMFKCDGCNLVVDVVTGSDCCEEIPGFKKLEEKTADGSLEKHVPFVEEYEKGYVVKVGRETAHPMTPEHFIELIEILVDGDRLYRKYLKPGDEPLACFEIAKGKTVVAREYCNIHGLWKNS
ncbi:MAG: desulfoferrodoxin family protein [Fusobacteriaceae bacterium]